MRSQTDVTYTMLAYVSTVLYPYHSIPIDTLIQGYVDLVHVEIGLLQIGLILCLVMNHLFTVRSIHLRKLVCRKEGERFLNSYLIPTFKSGYLSLSVLGGFSMKGQKDLVRIYGSLDQHKYMDILRNNILPFSYSKHDGLPNFVLQQDWCGPHRPESIKHYLEAENSKVLRWPT